MRLNEKKVEWDVPRMVGINYETMARWKGFSEEKL